MCVARRSRKKRSWLITTAQPAKFSIASSSARQRLDVEVVGRLVEQQDVAAGLEHLGHVHAVALTARELADVLLLVLALEVERADISAGAHVHAVDLHVVEPVGDLFPHVVLGIEMVAALVDDSPRCTVAPMSIEPLSGVSLPVMSLNSVDLPAPLGPITPTMPPGGRVKLRSSNSSLSP